ncbi:MAG: NADH-quinone oxidoreductase subunit NuoG [Thiohalomonadaceae bacterium]
MARITIDGCEYEAADGDNLLAAALSLGLELPYFCWHPALGSVGACRQCALTQYRDEHDTGGRIVMACMTPVRDGARFAMADEASRTFRRTVIEWLMTNHPHDCPVCDEGGECHLQDMTVMTGHVYRRYRFHKRTHVSQNLGPFVAHEMNRCIACYRCVRFYRDYAGGQDLDAFSTRNQVFFGRATDGVLESPFAGNLVEVCPTGVFTDKTLQRHYTRKWDLQSAPSVCAHCGIGCNTFVGERYGEVRRISNRYHPAINGYFICDRGRFGYEHLEAPQRIQTPLVAGRPASVEEALGAVQGGRVLGVGSPRASLETNHALRALVGAEHFSPGFGQAELSLTQQALALLAAPPAHRRSLAEAEQADAIIVLGEDVEQTAPRLSLALRQALRGRARARAAAVGVPPWQDQSVRDAAPGERNPLFVFSPGPIALDAVAATVVRAAPDELAALVRAIARRIDPRVPRGPEPTRGAEAVGPVADALRNAGRPLVVTGTAQGSGEVLAAAADLARALSHVQPEAGFICTVPECNTIGAALMGGMSVEDALERVANGDTLIVAENDLFRRVPQDVIARALAKSPRLIAIDTLSSDTTTAAQVVLPATGFAEATATVVNHEGRAQRRFAAFVTPDHVRPGWRWLAALAQRLGGVGFADLKTLHADLAGQFARFARVADAAPTAAGLSPPLPVPRQSLRFSGRTAMFADRTMFEPPPPADADSPLAFSMEGQSRQPRAGLEPRYWQPGWNSPQAVLFYLREVNGPLRTGEAGVCLFGAAPVAGAYGRPAPETPRDLLAVPVHHLFGSEELSAHAPGIASLAPPACVFLHEDEAARHGVKEGDRITVIVGAARAVLPVRVRAMASGVIGVSAGMGELRGVALPAAVRLEPAP